MANPRRRVAVAFLLAVAAGWACVCAHPAGAQVSLGFFPSPANFFFAGNRLVSMYVLVNSTSPIQACDVDVIYDPAVLKAIVVSGTDQFDGDEALPIPPAIDNLAGEVQGIVDSKLGAPAGPGQFYLASIVFRVLKPGSLTLEFKAFTQNEGFADATGSSLSGQSFQTTVTVHPSEDPDMDGLSTQYELLVTQTDPLLLDTDGNGIDDGAEDSDGDGLTDSAEYVRGTDANTPDTDLDGFTDGNDNCPHTYNPSQADADGDGIGDACDPDGDNDLLDDVDEPGLGLDPTKPDWDGDGFLDGEEIAMGTSPHDPGSFPTGVPALGPWARALLVVLFAVLLTRRIHRA